MSALHGPAADVGRLPERVAEFIAHRLSHAPLGRTATRADLERALAGTILPEGLGPDEAWRRFTDVVVPSTIGLDSERFLAFVPMAPTAASVWMDAAVGAASFSAESWLEAAGAVAAENQALRWLADLAGLPDGAGGCFMSGGSIGNLSALAVAREHAPKGAWVAVADTAHASVRNALHLLGLPALVVPTGPSGRFTGDVLRAGARDADIGIVVASAGSTNAGMVDDLSSLADAAAERGSWLHVDAAYGGAALLVPEARGAFGGIERADSLIVDPHKWLFSTSGSCALLYRDPSLAAAVHTQHGPYLDLLHADADSWNPSDFGFQLTRRACGLPLWFSLAVHGTDAYTEQVRRGIELARFAARRLSRRGPVVEVIAPPELSVVLFRRRAWGAQEWAGWAEDLLARGIAFVAPTTWQGEAVGRLVFLHPSTTESIVDEVVSTLT